MRTISEVQQENIEIISAFGDYYKGFNEYAKSIREMFFLYMQVCINANEEISISQEDVYNVNKLINFLEDLKYEKNK